MTPFQEKLCPGTGSPRHLLSWRTRTINARHMTQRHVGEKWKKKSPIWKNKFFYRRSPSLLLFKIFSSNSLGSCWTSSTSRKQVQNPLLTPTIVLLITSHTFIFHILNRNGKIWIFFYFSWIRLYLSIGLMIVWVKIFSRCRC